MNDGAGTAHRGQAVHIAPPVDVVEYVEQRAVDDGVEPRSAVQAGRVGHLEAGVDAAGGSIGPGQLDRSRGEVDAQYVVAQAGEQDGVFTGPAAGVEHRAADGPAPLEVDDRRLRFADHPGCGATGVHVVEQGFRRCRFRHVRSVVPQQNFRSSGRKRHG